jgi:hypothetical protein
MYRFAILKKEKQQKQKNIKDGAHLALIGLIG